jgi:hypothetical protein
MSNTRSFAVLLLTAAMTMLSGGCDIDYPPKFLSDDVARIDQSTPDGVALYAVLIGPAVVIDAVHAVAATAYVGFALLITGETLPYGP